jgi:hypothetical protein
VGIVPHTIEIHKYLRHLNELSPTDMIFISSEPEELFVQPSREAVKIGQILDSNKTREYYWITAAAN